MKYYITYEKNYFVWLTLVDEYNESDPPDDLIKAIDIPEDFVSEIAEAEEAFFQAQEKIIKLVIQPLLDSLPPVAGFTAEYKRGNVVFSGAASGDKKYNWRFVNNLVRDWNSYCKLPKK